MPWLVEILNDTVRMEIKSLPADIQARFLHLSDLITQSGLDRIGEPYVKHLENKLWEMRLKGRDGIARALTLL
jgi:phage-related protein